MKPWDHERGTHEAARLLRWVAAVAETQARSAFDETTLQTVIRSRRRLEDLLSGVPIAAIASPEVADGFAMMLDLAFAAAGPWGGERAEGVSLAAGVLGRVGLVELGGGDPANDDAGDPGETRDSAGTPEAEERGPLDAEVGPAKTDTEPM